MGMTKEKKSAMELRDWQLYEESLVTKNMASGMGILEARKKAQDVIRQQQAIKKAAADKLEEARGLERSYRRANQA